MRDRFISDDLRVSERDVVPLALFIPEDSRQGQKPNGYGDGQTIVQFYTGNNGGYFICMLDFENWGDESCPRFSYYIRDRYERDELRGNGSIWKFIRCSTEFDWKKVDDGE